MQKPSLLLTILFVLAGWLLIGIPAAQAQLYPGDANNDGRVNHIDILYIGYAYGTYGPVRLDTTVDYAEVSVPLLWGRLFPDSTNFAYADADGNGIVNFGDFLTVHSNYGNKRANPTIPTFLIGTPGRDPQIRLGSPANIPLIREGDAIEIPILLEGPDNSTLPAVNGVAFTLEYDQQLFKEVRIDFTTSWLGRDSSSFTYQANNYNRLEIAQTRFGKNPVSGKGRIGVVKAIIEDDIIGFLTRDSALARVKAHYIKLVNGDFEDIATAGSEITFMIYDATMAVPTDEILLAEQIQVFPNPTSDALQIHSPTPMQQVELFDLQGKILARWTLQSAYTLGLSLAHQPPGILGVRIITQKGIITKKVLFTK